MDALGVDPTDPDVAYAVVTTTRFVRPRYDMGQAIFVTRNAGDSWRKAFSMPDYQYTYDIEVDRADPTRIFVGSGYMSTDSGGHWTEFTRPSDTTTDIDFDPHDPNGLFAATDGGLYRSADLGRTWGRIHGSVGFGVVVHPASEGTLYYATQESVEKSTDGGTTWTILLEPPEELSDLEMDPVDHSILYAAGWDGVRRSLDGGESWTLVNEGREDRANLVTIDLAIDPANPSTIYAWKGSAQWEGGPPGALWRSRDRGDHWQRLSAPGIVKLSSTGGPSAVQGRVFAPAVNGVYTSSDEGGTWTLSTRGLWREPVTTIEVLAGGGVVLTGGYFPNRSQDGGSTWSPIALPRIPFRQLRAHPTDPNVVYFANGTNLNGSLLYSTDQGTQWSELPQPSYAEPLVNVVVAPSDASRIYGVTQYYCAYRTCGEVHRSSDGGSSWTATGLNRAVTLAVDPANEDVVYGGGKMFRSVDGGTTWRQIDDGLDGARIHSVAIDPANRSHLVVGSSDGRIFQTMNRGGEWHQVADFRTGPWYGVKTIVFDPTEPRRVVAGLSRKGVWESIDGGSTWTSLNDGLPSLARRVSDIAIDPSSGDVHAATQAGVYTLRKAAMPPR